MEDDPHMLAAKHHYRYQRSLVRANNTQYALRSVNHKAKGVQRTAPFLGQSTRNADRF
jgi:hypothetical protein